MKEFTKSYAINRISELYDLINERDEKIKELEKILKKKEEFICELGCDNIKLTKSQNQKAIECLEKVKEYCEAWKQYADYYNYVLIEETAGIKGIPTLYEYINNQIAELRGEK